MQPSADQREFATVVLGALLHDIGKFFMRARSLTFPVEGRHPEVSANFVGAFSPFFETVADAEKLKAIVRHHHLGQAVQGIRASDIDDARLRALVHLVSAADHLSASERGAHVSGQDYHTTPLASVFQRLWSQEIPPPSPLMGEGRDEGGSSPSPQSSPAGGEEAHGSMSLHPTSLGAPEELSERHFPEAFEQYAANELEPHLRQFGEEWRQRVSGRGLHETFDTVLALTLDMLHRYTWCIPADTQEVVPDISLFDHLKTTAAIAACLYRYAVGHNELDEEHVKERQGVKRFCLVVGDLSGIQDYIFDITTGGDREGKGAARRLRARSLYIQMLTDVLAHRILHSFDLPLTNVLMQAGGRFYLLLPNLPETQRQLEEVAAEADDWLLEKLNGDIAANLAWVTFGDSGFGGREAGWSTVLWQVNARLAQVKANRMKSVLVQSQDGWDEGKMAIDQRFEGAAVCDSCQHRPQDSGNPNQFCRWCQDDLDWGKLLPNANRLSFYSRTGVQGAREVLSYSVAISPDQEHRFPGDFYVAQPLNQPSAPSQRAPTLMRYIANHIPTDEQSEVLPFDKIAEKAQGRHYLAFAKADVDSLGSAFAFGLGEHSTASRVATLSRQLELFFTGWVEHKLRSEKFANCYTIFSGGDDLFLVGPWNIVLELLSELREDFARWTVDKLTFSAGVLIAGHHYPIPRAAGEVEELLEKAKGSRPKKASLSLFGHTLGWEDWTRIRERWKQLEDWTRAGNVATAFLYSLREYGQMWQRYKGGDVRGLRFQPLLAYNISRNLDRNRTRELYQWAEALTRPQPFSDEQRLELDNLGLMAQLLILGKEGGGQE